MAIGWVSLLKTVPWADVIASAPAVADGAKKLWKAVGRKTPAAQADGGVEAATPAPALDALASLQRRVEAVEASNAELHAQMLASSELITALAEQNAELVKRAEANRVRLLWLSMAVIALFAFSVLILTGQFR